MIQQTVDWLGWSFSDFGNLDRHTAGMIVIGLDLDLTGSFDAFESCQF